MNSSTTTESPEIGYWFSIESKPVANIHDLSKLLLTLEGDPSRFIVRGTAADTVDTTKRVRRRLRRPTGAVQEAPFIDIASDWVMLDVDKQVLPHGLDLLNEPEAAIEYLIGKLPKEFHNVTVHYQLSGSAGVFTLERVSAHLFFWLDRPATSAQLKQWAMAVNHQHKLIDEAVFTPVQPHYTAAPSFATGCSNPFAKKRSGLIKKTNVAVTVDYSIIESLEHAKPYLAKQTFAGVSGYNNILAQMGDGAGGQGFHQPLRNAIASYVSVNGREKAEATREALKDDLRSRIEAANTSNHSFEDIERYSSDSYLDSSINGAIEKFGDAHAQPAYFDAVEVPVEEAEEALNAAVDRFSNEFHHYWSTGLADFASPPCMAIKATAGLGKTSKLIARLIKNNALRLGDIHYFVPTHNLSNQLLTDLDDALDEVHVTGMLSSYTQRRTQLIAGRDKTDENGNAMCEKASLAKQVATLGLPVSTTLCKSGEKTCQFYDYCGYQRQFGHKKLEEALEARFPDFNEELSDVKVMAHNHLFLNTKGRMRAPKLVIVDEAFWQTGIDETLVSISDLIKVGQPISRFICDTLVRTNPQPLLKAIRDAGYDQSHLEAEAEEIEKEIAVKIEVKPDMVTSEQVKTLESSAYVVKTHTLLRHLSAELAHVDRDESHVVRFEPDSNDKNNKQAGKLVMTTRKHLNVASDTPIIFIDANAQKAILEQFVESVEVVEIAAQRKATIHQFTDRSFSKGKLLSPDGELLSQVKAFIAGVASKGATLVACTKAVKTAICGVDKTYEGASFVNFGNLRGLNDYAAFDNVIILGREQPAASGMSDQARAMWWDSEESLRALTDKSGNLPYINEPRGYRGILRGSVQVQTHPDWRAQLLLEQIREAESEQALDRLRLLRGEGKQRQVYILSNLPLNVTIDYGWSWKQYQKSIEMLRICEWQVPKKTKGLMALFPEISERTARDWLNGLKTAESLIINTIRESAVF